VVAGARNTLHLEFPGRSRNFRQRVEPDFVQLGNTLTTSSICGTRMHLTQIIALEAAIADVEAYIREALIPF
jgi:hypothetical protein